MIRTEQYTNPEHQLFIDQLSDSLFTIASLNPGANIAEIGRIANSAIDLIAGSGSEPIIVQASNLVCISARLCRQYDDNLSLAEIKTLRKTEGAHRKLITDYDDARRKMNQ